MSSAPHPSPLTRLLWPVAAVGGALRAAAAAALDTVAYVGGMVRLLGEVLDRAFRALTGLGQRVRLAHLADQCLRVGVRSIPIVCLVQFFIGIILALNMAPTLQAYGQLERVADVIAVAVLRELGPLFTAILLSGFAGASIAAELGAMVEGEEIKALRAHALDPIRFLVVPRVVATSIMLVALAIIADAVAIGGGLATAVFVLDISPQVYLDSTAAAVGPRDYLTGLSKAAVFGMLISLLACFEGLRVSGGAEGVGRATTTTVVKSIVALIGADMLFSAVFYTMGW